MKGKNNFVGIFSFETLLHFLKNLRQEKERERDRERSKISVIFFGDWTFRLSNHTFSVDCDYIIKMCNNSMILSRVYIISFDFFFL